MTDSMFEEVEELKKPGPPPRDLLTDSLLAEYRVQIQQIDALRVYNTQLEELIESQNSEMRSLESQIESVTVVERGIMPLMLRMLDSLESFVELDIPFLLEERRERVAELRDVLGRADVTTAEKYRRLLEAYQIETEYGRTIEAYSGQLQLGSDARTVDFLRIGRLVLSYQSLDGQDSSVWNRQTGAWEELPDTYRSSIRQGLRIARKQAAPDLLRLPISAAEGVE